jgi:hypothetical protein
VNATTTSTIGHRLAAALNLTVLGTEGHDLRLACVSCNSSDAARLHQDEATYFCYSCQKALSPWDLCKVVVGHDQAKRVMHAVGLFSEVYEGGNGSNGHVSDGNGTSMSDDDVLAEVARLKGCTAAGLKAFGAVVHNRKVSLPMFDASGGQCSSMTLGLDGGKGLYAKGKPVGLFLPVETSAESKGRARMPQPGEQWVIVEGPKDASVVRDRLDVLAAGLPGNTLKEDLAPAFKGVHVVLLPDADKAGVEGAEKSGKQLAGIAASVRIGTVDLPIVESHGKDVRDIIRELGDKGLDQIRLAIQEARPVGGDGKPQEQITFTRLTCAELDQGSYNLEYLIDRTLVAGQPCIVAGGKKSLKTSIVIDMGISLATMGYFLGTLRVNRHCRVAIMCGESGMATLQETARRIADKAGWWLADIEGLFFTDQLPQFENLCHLDALREFIKGDALDVLVVDPTYLCMPGDDVGNLFTQGARLRGVSDVCRELACTLVLVHHCRKGGKPDPFSPPELEDIAWAGFQEYARQWLLIGRRERYEPGTGDHRLWLNVGGSAGHSGLWAVDVSEGVYDGRTPRHWDVRVTGAEEARETAREATQAAKDQARAKDQAVRVGDAKQRIIDALVKFPDGETPRGVRVACGLNPARFDPALAALIREGSIVPCDIGKANRKTPYEGYKLADDDPL